MLKGLFYSEFHNTAGPVLVFQAPDECGGFDLRALRAFNSRNWPTNVGISWLIIDNGSVLSSEVFDSVSGYIIIDKELCGKIITGGHCLITSS